MRISTRETMIAAVQQVNLASYDQGGEKVRLIQVVKGTNDVTFTIQYYGKQDGLIRFHLPVWGKFQISGNYQACRFFKDIAEDLAGFALAAVEVKKQEAKKEKKGMDISVLLVSYWITADQLVKRGVTDFPSNQAEYEKFLQQLAADRPELVKEIISYLQECFSLKAA